MTANLTIGSNDKPRLTIVIPVYNRASLVERTLHSVLRQTLRPLRVIIVDNNSTDDSVAIVARWIESHPSPGLSVELISEKRPGAWRARAAGQALVSSEYISFFDSDDEMYPQYARTIVDTLDSDRKAQLLIWPIIHRMPDGKSRRTKVVCHRLIFNHVVHSIISTQRFAARTEWFISTGGWNQAPVPVWDDWVLGLRLFFLRPCVAIISTPLAEVHVHDDSITGTNFSHKRGMWEASVEKARENALSMPALNRLRINRMLNYKLAVLAGLYRKEGEGEAAESLMQGVMKKEPSRLIRWVLGFTFRYVSLGFRGAATIVSPFFPEP